MKLKAIINLLQLKGSSSAFSVQPLRTGIGAFFVSTLLMLWAVQAQAQCAVNPPPNLGPDQFVCEGTTVLLNAGNYSMYAWSTGATTQTITLTTVGTHVISVSVTDFLSCTGSDTIVVQILPKPTLNLGPDFGLCQGDSSIITGNVSGTAPFLYMWSTGTTTQNITIYTAGAYSMTVVDPNGCIDEDTVLVGNIPVTPPFIGNDTTICTGDTLLLDAGPGYLTHMWSIGATTQIISAFQAATYSLTVTDVNGCSSSDAIALSYSSDCVYPGDADHDGVADNNDLLAIGAAFNATGPVRPNASLVWDGQHGIPWSLNHPGGANYMHSDCDGSGVVDANDTTAILLNYGMTHLKGHGATGGPLELYLEALNDSVQAGDTAVFTVMLGSSAAPADSIFGLAFTVNYDTSAVDSQGMIYAQFQNCWFAPAGNRLELAKDLYPAPMADLAVVRTGINDTTGFGEVCRIGLVTIDNISGKRESLSKPLHVWLSDVRIVDRSLTSRTATLGADSTVVVDNSVGQASPISQAHTLEVLPVPAHEFLMVSSRGGGLGDLRLIDLQGREVLHWSANGLNRTRLEVGHLGQGLYILEMNTVSGPLREKIIVRH